MKRPQRQLKCGRFQWKLAQSKTRKVEQEQKKWKRYAVTENVAYLREKAELDHSIISRELRDRTFLLLNIRHYVNNAVRELHL